MDKFTIQYIETALWATNDQSTPEGGEPLDKNYDTTDLAPETLQSILKDCEQFQRENEQWLTPECCLKPNVDELAGHDFFLTRNRHGAGFWDGDWTPKAGKALTEASHAYGETNLYVGDDDQIYLD
jgi:hypothetical protein